MTIQQRMAVEKWLTARIKTFKDDALVPAAKTVGEGTTTRAEFGGRLAGKLIVPTQSRAAAVTDEAALLAWVTTNYPDRAETAEAIDPARMPEVLELLDKHLPGAIIKTRIVRPQFAADLVKALKSKDRSWTDIKGTKYTEIPGITVGLAGGTPYIRAAECLDEIIEQAWRNGEITMDGLLAIAAPEPVPAGRVVVWLQTSQGGWVTMADGDEQGCQAFALNLQSKSLEHGFPAPVLAVLPAGVDPADTPIVADTIDDASCDPVG